VALRAPARGRLRRPCRREAEAHASDFWRSGTNGCVRLPQDSVTGLKSKWNNRTVNKRDPYAELTDY